MRNMHAKCHEFSMHRNDDMNLSLFSFFEFCTLEEQELRGFQPNLFLILYSCILFVMDFQSL
jgi:hypothetical protein